MARLPEDPRFYRHCIRSWHPECPRGRGSQQVATRAFSWATPKEMHMQVPRLQVNQSAARRRCEAPYESLWTELEAW